MLRPYTLTAIVSFCALVLSAIVFAQESEKRVKMRDLPEAVRKTVQEQSKGATLRGLAKEVERGKTFYEAELKVNGHNKDVLIDPTGSVVEIEEEVELASVPPAVKSTIETSAGKGRIKSVEAITKGNKLEAYEAHIKKGARTSEIKVDPAGKLMSAETADNDKEESASRKPTTKTKKP